jgi:pimeloyl-ACP methyl ester carboxylesterase
LTTYARSGSRKLAYDVCGDPNGTPVVLLHGMPGSRHVPRPRALALGLLGIRLIVFDRPGYGESDRDEGRDVAAAAEDVATIADHAGVERFAVVGRSGGGPHALACAALLPRRVMAAAALAGIAPRHAAGLDWFAGMGEVNRRAYLAAWTAVDLDKFGPLVEILATNTGGLQNAEFMNTDLHAAMAEADRKVLRELAIRQVLDDSFRRAVANKQNVAAIRGSGCDEAVLLGWFDDTLAFGRSWGFELGDIKVPVLIWHGAQDPFSPAAHSRWLAGHVPGATLVVDPDAAHFGALPALPFVLEWLREHARASVLA